MSAAAKRPKAKRGNFTMRITDQLRRDLEAAADREGRSLSEIAERWLEAGARTPDIESRLSGVEDLLIRTVKVMAAERKMARRAAGGETVAAGINWAQPEYSLLDGNASALGTKVEAPKNDS